jgi:hypothetical protein
MSISITAIHHPDYYYHSSLSAAAFNNPLICLWSRNDRAPTLAEWQQGLCAAMMREADASELLAKRSNPEGEHKDITLNRNLCHAALIRRLNFILAAAEDLGVRDAQISRATADALWWA